MSVSTLANFIAAVNAATGKSGSVAYNVTINSNGDLAITRNGLAFLTVTYMQNPDWGGATDANPTGSYVVLRCGQQGVDSSKNWDAQAFINMLNAN